MKSLLAGKAPHIDLGALVGPGLLLGLVALVLVVWLARNLRPRSGYQGVVCFEGLPGSGKSYSLAEVGVKRMKEGRVVYSNLGFDLEGARSYKSFEELCEIPDGSVILLDEAPLYFNSRKWKDFPDGVLYRLSQVRKDGLEFYYSAIDEDMVDVNLRRITFWTWHCKQSILKGRFTRWRTLPAHRAKQSDKPTHKQTVKLDPVVCEAYDTLSKVAVRKSGILATASDSEHWVTSSQARPALPTVEGRREARPEPSGSSGRRRGLVSVRRRK